jgi:hypothetical protein
MAEWGDFSKAVSDEFVMTGSDREKREETGLNRQLGFLNAHCHEPLKGND